MMIRRRFGILIILSMLILLIPGSLFAAAVPQKSILVPMKVPQQRGIGQTIVQGTVTDMVQGWPLYAEITVATASMTNTQTIYSDPITGAYSVTLMTSDPYTFSVDYVFEGYMESTRVITPSGGTSTENFALMAEVSTMGACLAPGYETTVVNQALNETFDTLVLPTGWTNTDNITTHVTPQAWTFNDPGGEGNLTGGSGGFADINSDFYGLGQVQNAELWTSELDLSAYARVRLEFDSDYNNISDEIADVDVSLDGGTTWTNVWRRTGADYRTTHEVIDLTELAAGESSVLIRFHYYQADYDWWWQIDNVMVREINCEPLEGGLLIGHVYDDNTGLALNGATITSSSVVSETTTTMATPNDPNVDDGLYILFSSATGAQEFTASMSSGYGTASATQTIVADAIAEQDFFLLAGQLEAMPTELSVTMLPNQTLTEALALQNTGPISVAYEILEYQGILTPTNQRPETLTQPWVEIPQLPLGVSRSSGVVINDFLYVIGGESSGGVRQGVVQRYDPATATWDTSLATMAIPLSNHCVAAIDDQIYVSGGTPSSGVITPTIQIYDTTTDTWSTIDTDPYPTPVFGPACASYNGEFYVFGGLNDTAYLTATYKYDPDAAAGVRWSSLAPLPQAAGFGQATVIGDQIYYAGLYNGSDLASVYVYDTATDQWNTLPSMQTARGGAGVWSLGSNLYVGGGGWTTYLSSVEAYDTTQGTSGTWQTTNELNLGRRTFAAAVDTNTGVLYAAAGWNGNFVQAAEQTRNTIDVPWLSENPVSGSVDGESSETVDILFNSTGLSLGVYEATLRIETNTPYAAIEIPITLQVTNYDVQTDVSTLALTGEAGETVTGTLTITNTGLMTDSFDLSVSGGSWTTNVPTMVGPLAPGESITIEVSKTIAAGAQINDTDSSTIMITSQGDSNVMRSVNFTVTVGLAEWQIYLPILRK